MIGRFFRRWAEPESAVDADPQLTRQERALRSEPTQAIEDRVDKLKYGKWVALSTGVLVAGFTGYVNLKVTWGTSEGVVEGLIGPGAIGIALVLIEFTPSYAAKPSRLATAVLVGAMALGFALSYEHFIEMIHADSIGAYAGAATPDVLAGVALYKSLEMRVRGARDKAELERRVTEVTEAADAAERARSEAAEAKRHTETVATAAADRARLLAQAWADRAAAAKDQADTVRLAAVKANRKASGARKTSKARPSKRDEVMARDALLADFLADNPAATKADVVAEGIGFGSDKRVQESDAWKAHRAALKGETTDLKAVAS